MILGIDIGGTTTKLGLISNGAVIARELIPTTGYLDEHAFADALVACANNLPGLDLARLQGIGIGAPNANRYTGIIEKAPNLPWKNDVPLARMIADRTSAPVALGNDANAAALGEWRYGAGKGSDNLLVVTLGTGVGSGFIVNGVPVLGYAGNAGELGHTTIVMDGRPCTCGRAGCLEAYVSIRGLRRTYLDLDGDARVLEQEGVRCIADAANRGDNAALQTFRHAARWLAVGLANATAITGPERIVLCGGIARNGDVLMAPLQERFHEALLSGFHGRVELLTSGLPDDDAALLGAAALTTL